MKLIDFYIYRWFGSNVINNVRKFFSLPIKRLYYKIEEPEIIVFSGIDDKTLCEMMYEELRKK